MARTEKDGYPQNYITKAKKTSRLNYQEKDSDMAKLLR